MNQETFYQELIERYVAGSASAKEVDLLLHLMDDEDFCRILDKTMDQHLVQNLQKAKNTQAINIQRKKYRSVGIAASLLLMVSLSAYFFLTKNKEVEIENKMAVVENAIHPIENKAVLTLADGKKIILTEHNNGVLAKEAGMAVYKSKDGVLVYKMSPSSSTSKAIAYNTISTPRGGQYQIVLEDGSKIWLNAASAITFPTVFGPKERKIEISGEVYCEISKDAKRPFRVGFGKQVVEVLGTHFNINAYSDEAATKTTLLEGSIKLINTTTSQSNLLVPGEQGKMEKADNQLKITRVNTENIVSWKEGYLIFQQEPLESIMRKVSRWYNVDVVYENGIPQKKFGGRISKFDNIQQLLDVLSATGSVKFKTQGRRVTVMN